MADVEDVVALALQPPSQRRHRRPLRPAAFIALDRDPLVEEARLGVAGRRKPDEIDSVLEDIERQRIEIGIGAQFRSDQVHESAFCRAGLYPASPHMRRRLLRTYSSRVRLSQLIFSPS